MDWKRLLSLNTNTPGIGAALAALWAGGAMLWNYTHHQGIFDAQVFGAAAAAAYFIYTRVKVTPTADPRDGNGKPLVTAPPAAPVATLPTAPPAQAAGGSK